jgi:Asp/Glu/hydantoin racemase
MRILLINPNTSQTTTAQMVAIAVAVASDGVEIVGATARRGPPMIVEADQLTAAAPGVIELGLSRARDVDGIIVSAFGDPGLAALRQQVHVPVVGIAEAAMLEAATEGRHFGVATVTPGLVEAIADRMRELGIAHLCTGIRLTPDDPLTLTPDPERLTEALAKAVSQSIRCDNAQAVVIGGGPLGQAAIDLMPRFTTPIIAPIPAAMRRMMRAIV